MAQFVTFVQAVTFAVVMTCGQGARHIPQSRFHEQLFDKHVTLSVMAEHVTFWHSPSVKFQLQFLTRAHLSDVTIVVQSVRND